MITPPLIPVTTLLMEAIMLIVGNKDFLFILVAVAMAFTLVFVLLATWKLARSRLVEKKLYRGMEGE